MDRRILKNVASLFSIKVAGYLVPLISLPYLVRVLEPTGYGYLGYCLAINQYFILIVSYGFDLSATQKISKVRDERLKVSRIFWNVLGIRFVASLIGLGILCIATALIHSIDSLSLILFCCYTSVFGAALFPQWLFQGKEQLGLISAARIIFQIISLPLLLIFVNEPKDVWRAGLIQSLPALLISFVAFYIVVKRKWIIWVAPDMRSMWKELKDGWHIFISTAAISLYTSSVAVFLGALSGPVSVGYFVAANKLIQAANGIYTPISHAYYPRISFELTKNNVEGLRLITQLIKILSFITFCIGVGLFIFAEPVIGLLFGAEYVNSVLLVKIMSVLPILTSLSNIFGVQTLLTFGFKAEFSRVLIFSGGFSLFLIWPLIYLFNEIGASLSVVFTELLVTILMFVVVLRKKINIFQR
ncbi:flippase [Paraglaciecola sp. 20A4]|uniref:flippase n=1 Tax=Paraglaciecola sp. 20A4 TaxID=2687288 RepID=UPI001F0E3D32|nr:flippase [Paraglaciecola sp. 20A4]